MNRIAVAIALFVLWTLFAGFIGWQVRDGSADTVAAKAETKQQTARADSAEQARTDDHANAQAGSKVEQGRASEQAANESNFQIIEREVVRYVATNPDPDGCGLDADGLRTWRAANAGSFERAEPEHPAGAAGAQGGSAAPTPER